MVQFALNHMTVARLGFVGLVDLAASLGCVGIELRNDLPQPLFDGMAPERAGELIREKGLRLLALAEVKRFNDWSGDKAAEALALMRIARAAGAEAVSLIPRNDNLGMGNGERQAALRVALKALKPMLEDHGLVGMVEPLGFEICALRHKAEAVEAIEALGAKGRFKLVHDTFHHTLAHGGPYFPEHTGIVHVSGVTDPGVGIAEMQDAHRVLVTEGDRLGNIAQIADLQALGWNGPVSFEAFATEVHACADPAAQLAASFDFIRAGLARKAA
ncbi:TIM barrel protein [Tabrizicola oligotrophica]|uniref:TIM barrel protein n=1 Tax=Tabrizicola oligotrophica TaxID=2710650 RepID=A0A6M0QZ72_9RHOB|nr:TIM barrel protein [Tabrizicola oligotrophica]NEY92124.1 TIM barrel protein [Tabrizicola oligotrophica]